MTIARALMMASRWVRYIGGSVAVGGTTLSLPAHQAGDLLVVLSLDGGASTSIPADWTVIFNDSGTRNYCCYKIAESDTETVSHWSTLYSYTRRCSFVWRGARAQSPIGAVSYRQDDYGALTVPAITANHSPSWLACIAGAKPSGVPFTDGGAPTDFPGMTLLLNNSAWRRAWDSNSPKGSLSLTTITAEYAAYVTVCLEIIP